MMSTVEYIEKISVLGVKLPKGVEYKGAKIKIPHLCSKCGKEYLAQPRYVTCKSTQQILCGECSSKRRKDKLSKTTKQYIEELSEFPCSLAENEEYKGDAVKIKHICECGNIFTRRPHDVLRGFTTCKKCSSENRSKENHWRYDASKTDEERQNGRKTLENSIFIKEVLKRDNYTCTNCGDNTGGNLNVHHLDGYNWCIEKRYDVNNGVTLCECCHKEFHHIYGKGDNTKEQYEEWKSNQVEHTA